MGEQWGYFELTLDSAMRRSGMDNRRLAQAANIQSGQLRQYIDNKVKRPDLNVLARICAVLGCGIGDVLHYIPPHQSPAGGHTGPKVYSTGQIAKEADVHPNTIRFYERIGLISPAERAPNGYRRFTVMHLIQLRICRIIYGGPYTNSMLRNSALGVVKALKEWDLSQAYACAEAHERLVEREYAAALETAVMLKQWTERKELPQSGVPYSHKEAAALIGVTTEVIRNWERNGLMTVPRSGPRYKRVYGDSEIARLRIIYMLRQNNYSIAAIQRSFALYDAGNGSGAVLALHQPAPAEEIEFLSAGDHWLDVLENLSRRAQTIKVIVGNSMGQGSSCSPPSALLGR